MLPSQYYAEQCIQRNLCPDLQQKNIIKAFDALSVALTRPAFVRFFKKPVLGLYLWGSVGTGKTFLMDCFFNTLPLPIQKKQRLHFHQFMQQIHALLNQYLGRKNPLAYVAKDIAKTIRVLCLDEFFVKNIADAMVLSGLLAALFEQGVCLVLTSNIAPDFLYQHGLQRQRFLPAIALLKQKLKVLELSSDQDYRTFYFKKRGYYYSPLDSAANAAMEKAFSSYVQSVVTTEPLVLLGRNVPVLARSDEVVWFDFKVISRVPRSQQDYLVLSRAYSVMLVSDIPVMTDTNEVINFIHFVDILYDAKVLLIVSAAKPLHELYSEGRLVMEFQRTRSRLIEMQSKFTRF